MLRDSMVLKVLVALLWVVPVQGTRLAFHHNADGAYCFSNTYDLKLERLKFLCDSGEDLCRSGDKVIVEGHCKWSLGCRTLYIVSTMLLTPVISSTPVQAFNFIPIDVTQRTRACKFFGTVCTPVLDYSTESFEDEWHIYSQYGNDTLPGPGHYGFEKTFYWPDNSLTDYPWAGLSFNLVVDIDAEDSGNAYAHMRCHAPFTTVDYDTFKESGRTGSGFSPNFGANFGRWSMVGIVGVGAYAGFMQRKRRLQASTPSISLGEEDQVGCTNFEMMDPNGSAAAVRV